MDIYTATEEAYKKGYKHGKRDAVKHGTWIHSEFLVLSAKCSMCRCWITRHSVNEPMFIYCPHCGAKMDL